MDIQHKPWWLKHHLLMKLRHKKTFHPVPSDALSFDTTTTLSASLGGNRATCTEFRLRGNRATCTEFRHNEYAQCIAWR
ncbi:MULTISPECIES: hypothetical protein [unclassified Nostoc]|uniref:hypothetical protein n=1 Tax=unclassified Nostoc TaxID=2593658 RepID=UPI002AD2B009|nr:hypothetical protein [Nostoc sp. DedQUE03]MDZ7974388.1 hypothetical protein [Nostoc sp. DedQUE03]MDZ8047734.1 hypothetical protein [Nostoc sp. DedQUE02]